MHIAESQFGWDNAHKLHGTTPVEYLHGLGLLGPDVLGAHCIWLSEEDIQILRQTGTSVSYNPECHMKLALGISPVTEMTDAGITVSLGTDTCAVNDNMDLFEAMRVGAFLQKTSAKDPAVLPAYEALEMATLGGARALGMAEEIGSLEVGKKADLILVDLSRIHMRPINNLVNNLVYCASAAHDVQTVIVNGRLVVEERRLQPWDEKDVVTEAETYLHGRLARAGLDVPSYYSAP
jgi:5-methylthioadenosine/S-adenosylhomocysteine deaminase